MMRPVFWLIVAALPACIASRDGDDGDAVRFGLLLPFTGELAASGTGLERAAILAAEGVNAAGGVGGKPIELWSADTHSDDSVGANELDVMTQRGIAALVGPESASLAQQIADGATSFDGVFVSGGVASENDATDYPRWYRIVPSIKKVGQALAERVHADGRSRVAMVYVADLLGTAFRDVATAELEARGITVVDASPLPSEPDEVGALAARIRRVEPDGIVLIAYPRSAALFVQEWTTDDAMAWYLSPSLRSPAFVANVPPDSLRRAVGFSPGLPADATRFAAVYGERWSGDAPVTVAYQYYDAVVTLALAREAVLVAGGDPTDASELSRALQDVSGPPGLAMDWSRLDEVFAAVRSGSDINYRGASGPIDFNSSGDVSAGQVDAWVVRNFQIVDE